MRTLVLSCALLLVVSVTGRAVANEVEFEADEASDVLDLQIKISKLENKFEARLTAIEKKLGITSTGVSSKADKEVGDKNDKSDK